MMNWNQRPREIRNLFNPAFCGVIIARAIEGFGGENNQPMPFSLALLILPLCLHKRTRDEIKKYSRSYFTKIIQEHPEIRIDLAHRAQALFPYTMEAFAFLMHYGAIEVTESGFIQLNKESIKKTINGSQDTQDCQTVARSLGKKFAVINDRVTIYASLGIRP